MDPEMGDSKQGDKVEDRSESHFRERVIRTLEVTLATQTAEAESALDAWSKGQELTDADSS
jgi:hypothetical protein